MLYKRKINNIEFVYNSSTGKVYKAVDGLYEQIGTKVRAHGYYGANIPGVASELKLHRLIWYIVYGIWSTKEAPIDHIDQNKLNNRLVNLRQVSFNTNVQNRKAINVSWCKTHGLWRAKLNKNKKQISLGYFLTKKEALQAVIKHKSNEDK